MGMLVVFGAINVDFVFPVSALPKAGDTVWSEAGRIEPAGKGANQAIAAARDGARVSLAGAVGQDFLGDLALNSLSRSGIDLRDTVRVGATTGRAAICVGPKGHTTVVADRGANQLARASQIGDRVLGRGTTLLLQMDTDPTENAILIARARHAGAQIILNLSPTRFIDADALRSVDVLIASSHELAWLGERLGTGNNPASIHAAIGITTVRMMGVQGAEAMSDAGFLQMPALPIEMRDTTAAGDCFTGVFAAAWSRGQSLDVAMRRGAVAAALSATQSGSQAGMPDSRAIDAALRQAPRPTDQQAEVPD